jgi:hypothetical protein
MEYRDRKEFDAMKAQYDRVRDISRKKEDERRARLREVVKLADKTSKDA